MTYFWLVVAACSAAIAVVLFVLGMLAVVGVI